MQTVVRILLLSLAAVAISLTARAEPAQEGTGTPTVEALFEKTRKTLAETRDYTGKLNRKERFPDRMVRQLNFFKFQKPFKVYLKFLAPIKNREVIYVRGRNDNELKVHKGSFPDLTVNLDPEGSMAQENNHHPVTHFGFENLATMASKNLNLAKKRGEGEIRVEDAGTVLGYPAWKVVARFPRGGYNVTAREDETLWDISRRTGQDMHWILYSNPGKDWDEADDVDEGDKVFIPRYYGAEADFYLNKETGIPIKVEIRDRRGRLYESYEYTEVKTNVGLTARDFDPDNPAYDF